MTDKQHHILIVEDDIELAQWMAEYLRAKEYQVTVCHNGLEAVSLIKQTTPDIVILDGMLPGMDGIDVCKNVRTDFVNAIIMITARDEEIDEVLGLEMGADDYLTKPVRARALLTRIRKYLAKQENRSLAMVNNNDEPVEQVQLRFNQLIIDKQTMTVSFEGKAVNISSNEFEVLWRIAKQAGEVVSREELVSELRGFDYDGFDRTIDLRISRIRKKLGDNASCPFRIKTFWGKGYLFVKDAW